MRPIGLRPGLSLVRGERQVGFGLWVWVLGFGLGFLWPVVWVGREHTGPIPYDAGGAVGPFGPFPGSVGVGNF